MTLPIDFGSISLLLAIMSIVLLVTSEILSSRISYVNVQLDKKRLRNAAIATSMLFLITIGIRMVSIIS